MKWHPICILNTHPAHCVRFKFIGLRRGSAFALFTDTPPSLMSLSTSTNILTRHTSHLLVLEASNNKQESLCRTVTEIWWKDPFLTFYSNFLSEGWLKHEMAPHGSFSFIRYSSATSLHHRGPLQKSVSLREHVWVRRFRAHSVEKFIYWLVNETSLCSLRTSHTHTNFKDLFQIVRRLSFWLPV